MNAFEINSRLTVGLALGLLTAGTLLAKDANTGSAPIELPVAATVDGDPIYLGEVDALYEKLVKAGGVNSNDLARSRANVLQQLIHRRLAENVLKRDGQYVTGSEIEKALAKLKSQAEAQKLTLEQFAAKRGMSVESLRHDVAWQIGWERYLERNLTTYLETYFKQHHEEYDGTLVRASHILLRADRPGETTSQLSDQARAIRDEIESGKLTFEQAAEKYSAGPSRHQGGDLGYFNRHGAMVEAFAKAAFGLKPNEISQPVSTPFGVHLIRVTEIKPGTRQWTETADRLKGPASIQLYEDVGKEEEKNTKVEFTGNVPYLKPGTNELVNPAAAK
ncbi:MAG TPA: peptidylprolyl isomerase [Pirellulales bacterium]|jgi:parvulin-like peptidyl-prolyl isomerase|nr:peptidylprolyl isomerase [Pirellulales bacterium]